MTKHVGQHRYDSINREFAALENLEFHGGVKAKDVGSFRAALFHFEVFREGTFPMCDGVVSGTKRPYSVQGFTYGYAKAQYGSTDYFCIILRGPNFPQFLRTSAKIGIVERIQQWLRVRPTYNTLQSKVSGFLISRDSRLVAESAKGELLVYRREDLTLNEKQKLLRAALDLAEFVVSLKA